MSKINNTLATKPNDKIFETETRKHTQFEKTVYQTLFMAYAPFRYRILFVLFVGFLGRFILLGSTNVIGHWVDSFNPHANAQSWLSHFSNTDFLSLLTSMTLLGFLLTMTFRTLFSRVSAQAVSEIYDEVTWRTSRYPMSFMDTTPAGRIMTRFSSDYGNVFRLFGGPLAEFIAIVFDLIVMVILIGIASPYFLIFVGIISIANYWVYILNRQHLRIARRQLSTSRSPSIAHFAETAQGASTIRTFEKKKSFTNRFRDLDGYFLNAKLSTVKKLFIFSYEMNALSAVLFLITGLSSIWLLQHKMLTIGAIGVAFAFIILSGNTVQMFFEWLSQFEEAMIGAERLDEYLRKPIEPRSILPKKARFQTEHAPWKLEKSMEATSPWSGLNAANIEFKNIFFRYHDHQPWILNDISFQVQAGEKLGIIGATGSGKSTLIQVLFYLYDIQKGEVLIQGKSPDLSLDHYRNTIAYISQDPTLFKGTLRDNLDLRQENSDQQLKQSLERVGLWEWVEKQDQGLQFKIEERGKNLSSGEKQLICMARCLLQNAPIIVMDEATSAVDPQSEEIMVQATRNYFEGKTQIIVAHRLSTLTECDRILWMEKGLIKALGPTNEILPLIQSQQPSSDKTVL